VATLGVCDDIIYTKGNLCYVIEDTIRILALGLSTRSEVVIDVTGLLKQAIPNHAHQKNNRFRLLYCANHIVSCMYTSTIESTSWLICFDTRDHHKLWSKELESTDSLFVRSDAHYIYYGTQSTPTRDGHSRWSINGFDFVNNLSMKGKKLCDLVGSDFGSSVCFEIHDGYLYGLSNMTSDDLEEIDWSSFYYVVRFPLEITSPEDSLAATLHAGSSASSNQGTPNSDMEEVEQPPQIEEARRFWRRQHKEGPLDDRWTTLSLVVEEATNELKIQETREEWCPGASRSQRCTYITPVDFSPEIADDCTIETVQQLSSPRHIQHTSNSSSRQQFSSSSSSGYRSPTPMFHHDISMYPEDDVLVKLIQECDRPQYVVPRQRKPQHVHPADAREGTRSLALSKSKFRTYSSNSSSFIDLIDDPTIVGWQGQQRIRLRCESRKRAPLLRRGDKTLLAGNEIEALSLKDRLKSLYKPATVNLWPDYESAKYNSHDLENITALLNRASVPATNQAFGDDHGIFYVAGTGNQPKYIVYIGFDPSIELCGWQTLGTDPKSQVTVIEKEDDVQSIDRNLNGKPWVTLQRAMYRDIPGNVYFLGQLKKGDKTFQHA